jgi:hypothetical protein
MAQEAFQERALNRIPSHMDALLPPGTVLRMFQRSSACSLG